MGEETLPDVFMKTSITLISKPVKAGVHRKVQVDILINLDCRSC